MVNPINYTQTFPEKDISFMENDYYVNPVELSFLQNEIEQQRLENIYYDMLETYYFGRTTIKIPDIVKDEITQQEVRTNLLRPVLESYAHMLDIKSVTASDQTKQDELDNYLNSIGFEIITHEVISTAGLFGKCYLQFMNNQIENLIDLIVLDPRSVKMEFDPENTNIVRFAIKTWLDIDASGHPVERIEKYYPDRIEKYYNNVGTKDPVLFQVIPNTAGFIPIVEIKNRGGVSEIENGLGLQDSINKLTLEAHERALYNAGGQFYIIGNVVIDPTQKAIKKSNETGPAIIGGLGRKPFDIWALGNEVREVGKLEGDDIAQFYLARDKDIEMLAVQTATSIGYLQNSAVQTGSGVIALQKPQIDKVVSAQKSYTSQLQKVLVKALSLSGIETKVNIEWADPAQFSNKVDDLKEFTAGLLSVRDYHSRQGIPALKIDVILSNIKKEREDGTLKNPNAVVPVVPGDGNPAMIPQEPVIPPIK
jgi:hypothetical protein